MIDLATLTGAIIAALGQEYAYFVRQRRQARRASHESRQRSRRARMADAASGRNTTR
jgi:leucyl aminopeptidase